MRTDRRQFLQQIVGGAIALRFASRPIACQEQPADLSHSITVILGKPRQRGRMYGERFSAAIHAFLEREIYSAFVAHPNTKEEMLRYAGACAASIRKYSPIVMDELEGMAEGSGLTLEEIVLITGHEELWHRGLLPAPKHCTVFGSAPPDTKDDTTLVAQTWDWMESVYGLSSILHWKRTEGPSLLTYAYPGLWTGAGLNEKGLALCWHTGNGDSTEPRIGIPAYVIIAQMLYQESMNAALEEARRADCAGWFTFLVGDSKGQLATLRGTPKKVQIQMDATANGGRIGRAKDAKVDLARMQAHCAEVKVATTIDAMVFDCRRKEAWFTRRAGGVTPWKRFSFTS